MITKLIATSNQMGLVEWRDSTGPHRCYLPIKTIKPDLPMVALQTGIPFGLNWEDAGVTITGARVARALRERGVWTDEDLQLHLSDAQAAIYDLTNTIVTELIHFARITRQEV
jgi:hypothetical protein